MLNLKLICPPSQNKNIKANSFRLILKCRKCIFTIWTETLRHVWTLELNYVERISDCFLVDFYDMWLALLL